ncbi:hypothetical protein FA13DRAFT_1732066, partial [Coprinellus micaceus]
SPLAHSPYLPTSPMTIPPLPLLRGRSPNRTVPLPPVTSGRCRLHSLLQAAQTPHIQWDVRESPSRATCAESRCENALVVFAGASNRNYITILDILTHIHRAPRFALQRAGFRPAQSTNHREGDVPEVVPYNGSLLLAVEPSVPPASQIGYQTMTEMRTSRRVAGPRVQGVDGNGWRWIGLRGSTTEGDVWDLSLV